jgi:hypothetical protein
MANYSKMNDVIVWKLYSPEIKINQDTIIEQYCHEDLSLNLEKYLGVYFGLCRHHYFSRISEIVIDSIDLPPPRRPVPSLTGLPKVIDDSSSDLPKVTDDSSSDLICSICLAVFNDPIILQCGHNFCQSCINEVKEKQCPLCRKKYDDEDIVPNPSMSELVLNLKLKCKECSKIHTVGSLCDEIIVCNRCLEHVTNTITHLNNCSPSCSIIKCEQCDKYIVKSINKKHKKVCKKIISQ